DVGSTITFDDVLLVADGVRIRAGTPHLSDAKVSAEIVGHGRGRKIRVFKYKNKTRSRKTRGHRQDETTLRITKIEGQKWLTRRERARPATDETAPGSGT